MKIYGRIANFLQRDEPGDQGNNNNSSSNSGLPKRSPYNGMIFADLLCDLVNRKSVSLSFVRRMTLIESIKDVVKKQKQPQKQRQQQQEEEEEQAAARLKQTQQKEEDIDEEQEEMFLLLLTEIVMEGILTAPTLQVEDKDVIVREGLVEKRWDRVFSYFDWRPTGSSGDHPADDNKYYRIGTGGDESKWCTMFHNNNTSTADSTDDDNMDTSCSSSGEFWNYRRMIIRLFKTSSKVQACNMSESAWQRLKSMMMKTKNKSELDDLVFRALTRMCGNTIEGNQILQDMVQSRYYRLLWPDRLDCYEEDIETEEEGNDRKMSPTAATSTSSLQQQQQQQQQEHKLLYGRMLLPGGGGSNGNDSSIETIDVCCPICLGPINKTSMKPALELSCKHIFCASCIGQWIHQQQVVMPNNRAAAAGSTAASTNNSNSSSSWHCPVCRNEF